MEVVLDEKLCAKGVGSFCRKLGDAYKRGGGVAKDASRAAAAYAKACELGIKVVCESK